MMAGMDGFDLATRIRDRGLASKLTMIMLSSGIDAVDCDAHSLARCLTKPVKQSDLFDAIVETLDDAGVPAPQPKADFGEVDLVVARNVLLVDDGLVNQAVAANLLRRRGHRVTIANNGKEAVDLVAHEEFDIVLMDVQMPVMDGFEATARIREHEAETGDHLPIVAMTAHAMRGDRERCLGAGMDGYLTKPVIVAELHAAVESVVARSSNIYDVSIGHMEVSERRDQDASVEAPLQSAEIIARFGGDVDLVREVAALFKVSIDAWVIDLRDAVSRSDADALARIAHTIKGSVANFTSTGAFEIAAKIEAAAREGTVCSEADAGELELLLHGLDATLQSISQAHS
ncbi:MAG: response regulator, partial [bacterium]|nr:response regulator [Candidatus Kapabacteria bacterium]